MTLDELNSRFLINNKVKFTSGKGELPLIEINSDKASAIISLNGGQVLSYKPHDQPLDLLFTSQKAFFEPGKAIKGGCPICWPWFAENRENNTLPFHGFVRNQFWQVSSTKELDNGDIQIVLTFPSNQHTLAIWPYQFELTEIITLGNKLTIELITHNSGTTNFNITQAIHTYFTIGDINQTSVSGLNQKSYLDKVDNFKCKTQQDDIVFTQEVDRIYQHTGGIMTINDNANNRSIEIVSSGSSTTVVWNPWIDIAKNSKDLDDNDYTKFICVETANAADEVIEISPGSQYSMSACYTII